MNDGLLKRFIQLISATTGLHIREEDKKALNKKLLQRIKLLRLSSPEDYYLLLETNTQKRDSIAQTPYKSEESWVAQQEWKELVCLLTTGESYFFRDKGQFALLRNSLLPQIIESKNKENRTLRIWSAGCSTGEEAYSLAILVNELLTDLDDWDILILGTDINYQAIKKAQEGIYNSWSFRLVEPYFQTHYFHHHKTEWKIDERIRRMVKFRSGNLLKDNFTAPNSDIYQMDMILCRNVFVYFDPPAISVVLKKFYNTLVPGGYLMTAHTELYGQDVGNFQVNVLPESVIYRRRENNSVDYHLNLRLAATQQVSLTLNTEIEKYPAAPAVVTQIPTRLTALPTSNQERTAPLFSRKAESMVREMPNSVSESTSAKTEINFDKAASRALVKEAQTLFQKEAYTEAIIKAEQAIALHPHNFDAYYLLAQAYANLGEHNKAIYYCQQALEIDSLSVRPYHLLAHIAEEKKDFEKAKIFLKTIIYLAPSFIPAYLELGSLYQREGNTARAKKMLTIAMELLKELAPSATVEQESQVTAGELLVYVKKMLRV